MKVFSGLMSPGSFLPLFPSLVDLPSEFDYSVHIYLLYSPYFFDGTLSLGLFNLTELILWFGLACVFVFLWIYFDPFIYTLLISFMKKLI